MKHMGKRAVTVLLAAAMLLAMLAGCGAKSGVNQTVEEFEKACQALDARAMLACMNPTVAEPILAVMDLFGIGDTDDMLETLTGALNLFGDAGDKTEEWLKTVKITPKSYEFNSDKDRCTVLATLSYGGEGERTVTIDLILKEDIWYISDFDF